MKVISFSPKTVNKKASTISQTKAHGKSDTQLLSEAFKALKEQKLNFSRHKA